MATVASWFWLRTLDRSAVSSILGVIEDPLCRGVRYLPPQVGYAAPCKGNPQRRSETPPVPAMSQVFLLQSSVNATHKDPHWGKTLQMLLL
ncbi:hypothetical protein TNCV_2537311 [Trichonephila clavipes]|nr:hypothetical protein TNCV_2537311 [Trichonephila clavipes]